MKLISTQRIITSLVFTISGALLAAQIDGYWERTVAIVVTCAIAIAIILDEGVGAIRKHPDGEHRNMLATIDDHPNFTPFINALPHPLLIITNSRVVSANLSAIQLLGAPLIGQNIAGAFRHSAVIQKLSQDSNNNVGSDNDSMTFSGLGQRSQRWEMRVKSLDQNHRLVQLFDKSANHAAEKMRVDFVANASHELLTPLASIQGFMETLGDEQTGSNSQTRNKFLDIISKEAKRMELLIRDLMSLSRIESGAFADMSKEVRFADVVRQSVSELAKSSDKRGGDIIFTSADNLPRVAGDERLLQQMVVNIIANSMKYAQKDTPILVNLDKSKSGSMIYFSVKDHGVGIDSEHIPRLTERFYRVDSGRSKALGGTGLGLSLVKHIVQRHRGQLNISSKNGDGTHITILLPIAAIDHKNINHVTRSKRTIDDNS